MIKAVMFDLDGTLLPTNDDEFTKVYFGLLCKKLAGYGFEKDKLIHAVIKGVELMKHNDGSMKNSEVFWKNFNSIYTAEESQKSRPVFDEFYVNEFKQTKIVCGENPMASEIVKFCKNNGLKTILSTSPYFPLDGVLTRLEFVGLSKDDFDYITTYENSTFSKPNVKFYEEILNNMNLKPSEVIMFGNSEKEDGMPTKMLGIKAYMVGDYIVSSDECKGLFEHLSFDQVINAIENELKNNN